jgi:hypothetical protein
VTYTKICDAVLLYNIILAAERSKMASHMADRQRPMASPIPMISPDLIYFAASAKETVDTFSLVSVLALYL